MIQAYDPSGAVFKFWPALHVCFISLSDLLILNMGPFQVEDDLTLLNTFNEAVIAGFQDGLPLHISNPEKSVFSIMTESEFENKTVEEIQEIIQQKHIVVKDVPTYHQQQRRMSHFDSFFVSAPTYQPPPPPMSRYDSLVGFLCCGTHPLNLRLSRCE